MSKFSKQTEEMLSELDRVAMLPYRWEEEKILARLKEFYTLYGMDFPKRIERLVDIFDSRLKEVFERQARQAGQARQAWQARQAGQAWQARQAWQAGQAWQAIEYATDYWEGDALVFTLEYATENPVNKHDKKFVCGQRILLAAKEAGLGFFVDDEQGTLYLVPCATVRLNINNLHHSDNFPAIEWRSGASFYYLNGVNFPEELWKRVVSHKMSFGDILAIEDIDQRTQAMRYGNVEDFLKHVGARVLDTYQKVRPDGEPIHYSLYEIPHTEKSPFTETAYYMRYRCPSTGKDYMSGVQNDLKTIPDAMAWKFEMTPDDWKSLVPMLTES